MPVLLVVERIVKSEALCPRGSCPSLYVQRIPILYQPTPRLIPAQYSKIPKSLSNTSIHLDMFDARRRFMVLLFGSKSIEPSQSHCNSMPLWRRQATFAGIRIQHLERVRVRCAATGAGMLLRKCR